MRCCSWKMRRSPFEVQRKFMQVRKQNTDAVLTSWPCFFACNILSWRVQTTACNFSTPGYKSPTFLVSRVGWGVVAASPLQEKRRRLTIFQLTCSSCLQSMLKLVPWFCREKRSSGICFRFFFVRSSGCNVVHGAPCPHLESRAGESLWRGQGLRTWLVSFRKQPACRHKKGTVAHSRRL